MLKRFFFSLLILSCFSYASADSNSEAENLLKTMTLAQKIGQKIMLDFRFWCADQHDEQICLHNFTEINPTISKILSENNIGGIILFSNNLVNISQITRLTYQLQQSMPKIPLLMGTDQEGGIVARLPRDHATTFPGNMAVGAAFRSHPEFAYQVGKILGQELQAVGINIDFAPDVDVNVNPQNPVIHVRSFSDNPEWVSQLGLQMCRGIERNNVAATLKHFPGHGDTDVDSHIGLPIVKHNLTQAWKIDLFPFLQIIQRAQPELIMTAHIQYPALDNSKILASKTQEYITTPATFSYAIQHDLLRNKLDFQGVVISDALGMGAIANNFEYKDAVVKAFMADNDIALMPVAITNPDQLHKLTDLINYITQAVTNGEISERAINQSVLRILRLKIKLGLFNQNSIPLDDLIAKANTVVGNPENLALEKKVSDAAITLVQNNNKLLPLQLHGGERIHILMPWSEQGAAIAVTIQELQNAGKIPQNLTVSYARMDQTDLSSQKQAVDQANIIITGTASTKPSSVEKLNYNSLVFPTLLGGDSKHLNDQNKLVITVSKDGLKDAEFAFQILQYAHQQHKKTIYLSLLAPYELPNYRAQADALLAVYDHYGYLDGAFRGPSLAAFTRILFGISRVSGHLPVNIPDPKNPQSIIYPREFGLIF